MHPRRLLPPLLAALLGLTLGGCGGGGTDAASEREPEDAASTSAPAVPGEEDEPDDADPTSEEPTSEETTSEETTSEEPTGAVPEVLDFEATTVGGEPFEGASVAGRPVLLWFWAPWCPTCRGQVPQVQELATTHGKDLTVLGVGSLDSAEAIADFAADVDEITHLEDVDGELYRRFGITEQSSFVLLDDAGEVVLKSGYGGAEELDAEVAAVVG